MNDQDVLSYLKAYTVASIDFGGASLWDEREYAAEAGRQAQLLFERTGDTAWQRMAAGWDKVLENGDTERGDMIKMFTMREEETT